MILNFIVNYFTGNYRLLAERGTVSILLCKRNDGRASSLLNAPHTSNVQQHGFGYVLTLKRAS